MFFFKGLEDFFHRCQISGPYLLQFTVFINLTRLYSLIHLVKIVKSVETAHLNRCWELKCTLDKEVGMVHSSHENRQGLTVMLRQTDTFFTRLETS